MSSFLSMQNLDLGYLDGKNNNLLFENLNLDLLAGELVCFMGPNGIGKSTLLRTLAGLQKPLSGTVVRKKKISVVLTDRVHAYNMTVQDLVTFGRYPYLNWDITLQEEDHSIIDRSIAQVHLENLADKNIEELSDGQLQMTMIARALAQETEILLLDEPTAHLDLNNRVEIMNLLRHLARTANKAILVATHELDLALQTADKIWLATANKKILTGLPEDLVLDGSFDDVFQLKGFDLKTGKISHEAHRKISVQLIGEGHEYLWTKNALERSGYKIRSDSDIVVTVNKEGEKTIWKLSFFELKKTCDTLIQLLSVLENQIKQQ
ncbi:MAG: ABC transporter ATP-binding protein [Bacteroidota bacterium]